MDLCYHLNTEVLLVKRRPMEEGNSLIDTLIYAFLLNLVFVGFRSYGLILENLENTEKNKGNKISSMNASLNISIF